MCLAVVTKQYNKTSLKVHIGYKVFKQERDVLYLPYFWLGRDENRKAVRGVTRARWIQATDNDRESIGVGYKPGFHIFKHEQDAEDWKKTHTWYNGVVLAIKFRNVTCQGIDEHFSKPEVIVAQEILIPEVSNVLQATKN